MLVNVLSLGDHHQGSNAEIRTLLRMCAFGGFLLYCLLAYAFLAIASLCNTQHRVQHTCYIRYSTMTRNMGDTSSLPSFNYAPMFL